MLSLFFFSGSYCPSCKAMYPIIDSLEKEFVNQIVIERLNVETELKKVSEFNITSIPTIIFAKNNQPIERLIGPQIKSKLIKIIQINQ